MTKIIYSQDDGIVAFLIPCGVGKEINPATGKVFTIDEIAQKDVPTGKKYKKIEDSELPSSMEFRDAWVVDEADLTDGVGA